MPYTNIVFIKLFLGLFEEDDRFLYQLNESQQLLYIKMLYMAAITSNKIPRNHNFIKQKINYGHDDLCLIADLKRIASVFPKFIIEKDFCYFQKFDELHNYIGKTDREILGKSLGNPSQEGSNETGSSQSKSRVRVEKSKSDSVEIPKERFLDFVLLTKEEHQKLLQKFGGAAEGKIERLNNYIGSTGKKYKSHYHTILNWSAKDEVPNKVERQWNKL